MKITNRNLARITTIMVVVIIITIMTKTREMQIKDIRILMGKGLLPLIKGGMESGMGKLQSVLLSSRNPGIKVTRGIRILLRKRKKDVLK